MFAGRGETEMSEAEKLAEEHWLCLEKILHRLYVDAFVHGFKHAKEEKDR